MTLFILLFTIKLFAGTNIFKFLSMLLGASLLGNMLAGKGVIRAGEGTIRAGEGTIRAGKGTIRLG